MNELHEPDYTLKPRRYREVINREFTGRQILEMVERIIHYKTSKYTYVRKHKELIERIINPDLTYLLVYDLKDQYDWYEFLKKVMAEDRMRECF